MTISEAIDNIDNLKPNSYSLSDKIRWLSRLDNMIFREIIETHFPDADETFDGYTEETDTDTVLIAPSPYDEIYALYLASMMDYNNQEYVKFNNSNAMYMAAYQEFANYWNRTHKPKGNRNVYF